MPLVSLDLPAPGELRARWAAYAAVLASIGHADGCHAAGQVWHFDDGGGNWCDLIVLDGGRAVLQGNDHEYSDTYFREAAAYFDEPETDLLADAPAWWGEHLPPIAEGEWVGFVYGYDGAWQRAEYDLTDGFTAVGLPALSDDRLVRSVTDYVTQYAADQPGPATYEPTRASVLALAAAGPGLTEGHLAAVFGPAPADLGAGVTAARAFA
ncbi:MAG: proteophosphoglycan 5 [Kibdelosporangium sp.]